ELKIVHISIVCGGVGLEFVLRNWTVMINSSLVWLTVLILIEIVALETVLVVVLMSRLIKSRWTHLVTHTSSTALRGAVGVMKEFFISSKEFEEEEIGGGAFALALTSVTRLLEYLTLDLLSMIDKHSRGILSKKFSPAAESRAS
nr:hypothetical protein [Tanacetum cinerariifolium]